jgi:hypothetical protein
MRRQRPEQWTQRDTVAHIKARGVPGLVYLHPANGGARSAVEGAIFKSMGVVPGAPDLLLWHAGRSYALELKADGGRTTDAQVEMLTRLKDAGVHTAVAHGINEAVAYLETWGLLRGRVT